MEIKFTSDYEKIPAELYLANFPADAEFFGQKAEKTETEQLKNPVRQPYKNSLEGIDLQND